MSTDEENEKLLVIMDAVADEAPTNQGGWYVPRDLVMVDPKAHRKDPKTRKSTFSLTPAQLEEACDVWGRTPYTGSGSQGLSNWLIRHKKALGLGATNTADYGALVTMVREHIGDTTDYQTFYDTDAAKRHWKLGEYAEPAPEEAQLAPVAQD